ncbi:hypothetical protein D3C80_2089090 [compost metagenome]
MNYVGTFRADQGKLLNGNHRIHQRSANTTVLFVDGNAQQALRGQLGSDFPRVVMGMRTLQCAIGQLALGEATDGIGESLLFFCEMEMHD